MSENIITFLKGTKDILENLLNYSENIITFHKGTKDILENLLN